MRTGKALALLVLAGLPGAGCATVAPLELGRSVTVEALGQEKTEGELLAVEEGKVIVRGATSVDPVPLTAVRDVQVTRHTVGYRRGLLWSAVGGLATGAALYGSCRQVENASNCRVAGGVPFVLWMIVGSIASLSMESTTHFHLTRPTDEELRPFARFPQGLPPGLDLDSLLPPGLRRAKPEELSRASSPPVMPKDSSPREE